MMCFTYNRQPQAISHKLQAFLDRSLRLMAWGLGLFTNLRPSA